MSKTSIRLKLGQKITPKEEIDQFIASESHKPAFLLGSASNVEAVKADSYLYDKDTDLYGKLRLTVPLENLSAVNLVVGPMGSGKTNFLNNLIGSSPDRQMVINTPKAEELQAFYEEEKGDIIIGHPDSRSVVWDVFGEISEDRQGAGIIFENMLKAVRGENNDSQEWTTYAVKWLTRMAYEIIDENPSYADLPMRIVEKFREYKNEVADNKTGMQSDAIGTAEPVFSLLFKLYYIGYVDNRKFYTTSDMMKARRIFLYGNPKFAASLKMVNNALLAMLINKYMGRPNVEKGDLDNYTFFILDEYLTFKLDPETETILLTLCRSKRVCVFLGMQYLPADKERLKKMKASRYLTIAYRTDDDNTAEEIAKLTPKIQYQRQESNINISDNGFSLGSGMSCNEAWIDVEGRQVGEDLLLNLSSYTAFVEIKDEKKGKLRTFIRPPLFVVKNRGPEFIYSDVSREAPGLEEYVC